VALVHLVARLIKSGFRLLDCQFMTEHLRSFGAIEIPRDDFKELLADAIDRPAAFQRELGREDPCAITQESTRKS
jgi:leucyl/phenylalanyl-tRNA--protein transferase